MLGPWASYQIRKIAGCACAGNAGNVFPRRRIQRKTRVSDPGMHHGTCVTHVPWCMSGLLTCGGGENVPGIPGACAPAIWRIWQEAHGDSVIFFRWCQQLPKQFYYLIPSRIFTHVNVTLFQILGHKQSGAITRSKIWKNLSWGIMLNFSCVLRYAVCTEEALVRFHALPIHNLMNYRFVSEQNKHAQHLMYWRGFVHDFIFDWLIWSKNIDMIVTVRND